MLARKQSAEHKSILHMKLVFKCFLLQKVQKIAYVGMIYAFGANYTKSVPRTRTILMVNEPSLYIIFGFVVFSELLSPEILYIPKSLPDIILLSTLRISLQICFPIYPVNFGFRSFCKGRHLLLQWMALQIVLAYVLARIDYCTVVFAMVTADHLCDCPERGITTRR